MSEFKVGDRVYCPLHTNRVCTLKSNRPNVLYPLCIDHIDDIYTVGGKRLDGNLTPTIFHATPENHALLSQLYPNVEFEKPAAVGSDLTRQMLADGAKEVLCWVSDASDEDAIQSKCVVCITRLCGEHFDTYGNLGAWKYAVTVPRNYYAMDDE